MPPAKALCFRAVRLSVPFVKFRSDIFLRRHLMNGLSKLDETDNEYSLPPTDDLIRFLRSEVKVTVGHQENNP